MIIPTKIPIGREHKKAVISRQAIKDMRDFWLYVMRKDKVNRFKTIGEDL